jgi:hypothetical protein
MFRNVMSIGAISLALAAGQCLCASVIPTPRAEFRQLYSLSATGRVTIHNPYGDVRITGWDREQVLVEAFKKSSDPGQLDDARIVVDASSDHLSIRTQYGGVDAEHPASVEYRITVPRRAALENVRLVNGGLCISGLAGPVKASSVNGSIHAERLAGEADLSTVNGRVDASFARIEKAHAISLSSVNGQIRLAIPGGAAVELFARNLSGGIDTVFGRVLRASSGHRLHTLVNRGGTQVRVKNVNGGIFIRTALNGKSDRPWS